MFEIDKKRKRIEELEKIISAPDFWKDPDKAHLLLKERNQLKDEVEIWEKEANAIEEAALLLEIAEEEGDKEEIKDVEKKLLKLEKNIQQIELKKMLSGEDDNKNAFVHINAGAGGTEAQDWVEMLLRMYLRWAESHGFKTEIVDILPGEEAGIKNVTFAVNGKYAYGYLKAEIGIHRLVRISPFDTGKRRHTSFASVFVYPETSDEIHIEIDEKDLKIDTFRSSGAGGQHVNKTDSAVRITHIPTGIVAQCQNERSQHKNKAMALKILKAKLIEKERREREQKKVELHSSKKDIAWGSQIRSYILHPYKMVKDHRTNLEKGDVNGVLDGKIDDFIAAYLLQK
ncbi:MAG: peptide chain release factor 2 [Deltaproteobacteria bacterium]|nr:peptide chain release factor 2 [Deltaproteobacteria bacterium]